MLGSHKFIEGHVAIKSSPTGAIDMANVTGDGTSSPHSLSNLPLFLIFLLDMTLPKRGKPEIYVENNSMLYRRQQGEEENFKEAWKP